MESAKNFANIHLYPQTYNAPDQVGLNPDLPEEACILGSEFELQLNTFKKDLTRFTNFAASEKEIDPLSKKYEDVL